MIRDDIKAALVAAMKGGDKAATGTIRLIQSAIKNRDIEARTAASTPGSSGPELPMQVMQPWPTRVKPSAARSSSRPEAAR